jgi:hypothetical protein
MFARLRDPELQHTLLSLTVVAAVFVITAGLVIGQSDMLRAPWLWVALVITAVCAAADGVVCRKLKGGKKGRKRRK